MIIMNDNLWLTWLLLSCLPILARMLPQGTHHIGVIRQTAWWHDEVIKWKHFPRYWPFVWGIHRSPVNSPHKGQWRGALMFSLICVRINGWVNDRKAGDVRRYRALYDVTVMASFTSDACRSLLDIIALRCRPGTRYEINVYGWPTRTKAVKPVIRF